MTSTNKLCLSIPKPCGESWQQMRGAGDDKRYCTQCAQHVTDFSHYTAEELIAYFKRSDGRVCGRLTRQQLQKFAPQQQKDGVRRVGWQKYLAGCLLLLGIRQSEAQSFKAIQHTVDTVDILRSTIVSEEATSASELKYVTGTVIDSATAKPVEGVRVTFDGDNFNTLTDSNGYFEHPIRTSKRYVDVYFFMNGYENAGIKVDSKDLSKPLTVSMVLESLPSHFLGKVIIRKKHWWQFGK